MAVNKTKKPEEKTLRDLTPDELQSGLHEQKALAYDMVIAIEQFRVRLGNAQNAINAIEAELQRREDG